MPRTATIKLSICISTLNRAAFIGSTLASIIAQATADLEIVVVDGASTDNTEQVVMEHARRFDRLRYVRQDTNNGVDRDFDRAVELARGEYCWLLADDDLLKPGAVTAVLKTLDQDFSLILVNAEHKNFDMSNVLIPNYFCIDSDRVYTSDDLDRLFTDLGTCLICICCVVIKREIWLARDRGRYYGSRFVHVGVIFQRALPGKTLAIAEPLMSLRIGNEQTHMTERFQTWSINWPAVIWSLAVSESVKRKVCEPEPWRGFRYLLALRATKRYFLSDYRRWIRPRLSLWRQTLLPSLVAILPRKAAHQLYRLAAVVSRGPNSPRDAVETTIPRSWRSFLDAAANDG